MVARWLWRLLWTAAVGCSLFVGAVGDALVVRLLWQGVTRLRGLSDLNLILRSDGEAERPRPMLSVGRLGACAASVVFAGFVVGLARAVRERDSKGVPVKLKFEVPSAPEVAVPEPAVMRETLRTMSEAQFTTGLGADWVDLLKSIRDTTTFREMKSEREFEAATKAMMARHRMRVHAAQLRAAREARDLAKEDSGT